MCRLWFRGPAVNRWASDEHSDDDIYLEVFLIRLHFCKQTEELEKVKNWLKIFNHFILIPQH